MYILKHTKHIYCFIICVNFGARISRVLFHKSVDKITELAACFQVNTYVLLNISKSSLSIIVTQSLTFETGDISSFDHNN